MTMENDATTNAKPRLWSLVWQDGRLLFPLMLAVGIVSLSGTENPAAPGGIPSFDKIAHFCVFGLLATLILRMIPDGSRTFLAAAAVVALVSVFGLTDEFHQSFTPGRSVEFADWVADTLGALTAVVVYCRWHAYRRIMEYRPVRKQG
ncbi:MAG: VanZ family protein [Opitutaceae bacterium]